MTVPEIEEKVRREVDDNPALSAGDPDEGAEGHDDANAGEDAGGDGEGSNETAEEMQRADYGSDEDVPFDAPEVPYRARSGGGDSSSTFPIEANADVASQADSLLAQLAEYTLDDKVRLAATYIIGNIDANGRMSRALSAIASDIAIAEGGSLGGGHATCLGCGEVVGPGGHCRHGFARLSVASIAASQAQDL